MRITELDRINELAKIAKERELTAEEITERDTLRQAYLEQVTGQMKNILSKVKVVDEEGNDVTPEKLLKAQAEGMSVESKSE